MINATAIIFLPLLIAVVLGGIAFGRSHYNKYRDFREDPDIQIREV